jgi:hypothetical protein
MRRFVLLWVAAMACGLLAWAFWPKSAPPALIAGLTDEGLRPAPCPARSLADMRERGKEGVPPPTAFGKRLRRKFPLGSDAGALRALLAREQFAFVSPCGDDADVFGARWLSPRWDEPNAYVYWRVDENGRLTFLDGTVSRVE